MKVLLGAFNQKKALIGAFSVIVQHRRLIVCSTINRSVLNRLMDRVRAEVESSYDDILPSSQGQGGEGGQRAKRSIDMYYERRLIKAFNRLYRDLLRG